MASPWKREDKILYTEIVYYDEHGNEVGRTRMHDDTLHDQGAPESITPDELEENRG